MQDVDSRCFIQGTPEWEAFRNSRVGASDAPCIMGVGFNTPYELWQFKMGIAKKEQNSSMRRGVELEPIARSAFEKEVGVSVFPEVVINPLLPWQIASLDGLDSNKKVAVEIKCAGREDHSIALNNRIPDKYFPQLQHQMIVLNLDMMYYFSFDGSKGVVVEVNRENDYCEKLIAKELEFYKSLINFEPPGLTDRDYIQKNDANWAIMADRWLDIRAKIKEFENEEENIRNTLIHMAGQQSAEGSGIRLQKVYRKGYVDYTKVPELRGIDLEPYRKTGGESFRLMEIKA